MDLPQVKGWAHWSTGEGVGIWFKVDSGFRVSESLKSQGLKATEEKDVQMETRMCVCARAH